MGLGEIGKVLLPMHLGVFIAGIYLGASYGAIIGFITPLINSIFGLPMFPTYLIMAIELAAYGFCRFNDVSITENNIKRMRRSFRFI